MVVKSSFNMRSAESINLSEEDLIRLTWIIDHPASTDRLIERAKMILLAQSGLTNIEIAHELNVTRQKVARWRQRFLEFGIKGLEKDATRPGRMPELEKEVVDRIVQLTLQNSPQNGVCCTQQSLAEEVGVSASSVSRIWKKFGIEPKK